MGIVLLYKFSAQMSSPVNKRKTAQVLRESMETLDEVERLFTEGVREAGERTRTAGVETKSENTIAKTPEAALREFDIDDLLNGFKVLGTVLT